MITYRSDEAIAEWMRAYWRSQGEEIDWPKPYICFGVEIDGKLGMGVVYEGFNSWDVNMHIVLKDRRAISRKTIKAGFMFPFETLKVRRVTGIIEADNAICAEFCEKLGFVLEGRKRDAFPSGDGLIYGMTRNDCKWLR